MKSIIHSVLRFTAPAFCAGVFFVLTNGCSTNKPQPEVTLQRGWIGGEYKLAVTPPHLWGAPYAVRAFPKSLRDTQKAGILITALSTNTPAALAGLREGDLILALDHQPATALADFRHTIEQAAPGANLPVQAWRDGQTVEYNLSVGRETYKHQGAFIIGIYSPTLDLRFDPSLSLLVLGYKLPGTSRIELNSVKSNFQRKCNDGKYEPTEQDWAAWLAIFCVSKGKIILTQETASAR